MNIGGPINLGVLAGARIPHFDGPHVCNDGPVWSAVAQPNDEYIGLAYGNGRFVATGHGQAGTTPTRTMYSLDKGKTWTPGGLITNSDNNTPFSLRFGNGIFLAYMNAVVMTYTVDGGLTWLNVNPGVAYGSIYALQFGNGLFVLVNFNAASVAISASATGFVEKSIPAIASQCWWDFVRQRWLLLESGGVRCWTTTDFATFTQRGDMPYIGAAITTYNVAESPTGTIVCAYEDGTATTSYTDDGGDTWGVSTPLVTNQVTNVLFGNNIFIILKGLGGETNISRDGGRTWVSGNSLTKAATWLLAYNGRNSYAAVGSDGNAGVIANVGDC